MLVKGYMRSDEREFDDPALRAALRRAAGEETAPPELRSRIRTLLEQGGLAAAWSGAAPARSRTSFREWWARWQSPIYASIAAAVVVIGVGLLVLEYNGTLERWTAPSLPPPQ